MPVINDSAGHHVESPVGMADAKSVLGSSSNDLATLCMNTNINKWSAYKPVYMAKVEVLSDADFANGRMNAFTGYMVAYGIKIRKSSVITDYIETDNTSTDRGKVKSAVWGYDKPVKDGTNVFRLSDFNHYYHDVSIVKINLTLTFPSSTYFYIPQQAESGQILNFFLSWWDIQGATNASKLFNATNGIGSYIPSIILTYYASGTVFSYAKSAKDGDNFIQVQNIGSSTLSGASVSINTSDIKSALSNEGITLPNAELSWTACWVLLSAGRNGDATNHKVFDQSVPSRNLTVVRLEHTSGVDRMVMTSVPKKKAYISSISVTVTVKKTATQSGSYHRWDVTSVVFTFQKETEDTISFVCKGAFTCQVGSAYVSGLSPDSSGQYTLNSNVTVSGSGTKTVTLSTNQIYYMPTAAESYSNVIRFSGTYYLNNTAYGSWQGACNVETAPSESIGTLNNTSNLS